jgi:hypothetical protein
MSRRLVLLFSCLVMTAGLAHADRNVEVKWIGDDEIQTIDLGLPLRGDGIMGNTNTPAWAISNWIFGMEGYKYLFYPPQFAGIGCSLGFWVEKVHMVLRFGPEDVPATFDVMVDLEDALWDGATQCWVPGITDCTSAIFTVQIDAEGVYDIAVPLYDWCDCGYPEYYYFIAFHFLTEFEAGKEPSAVCDNSPNGCVSYNDYGLGWQDLVNYYGWPGELAMWAEVFCCDFPLSEKPSTWGEVKDLYR